MLIICCIPLTDTHLLHIFYQSHIFLPPTHQLFISTSHLSVIQFLTATPIVRVRYLSPAIILLQTHVQGGQKFAGDSDSPISIVPHLKLTSVLILKVPYSIKKWATCLNTFLRF